jgi:ABC-2 type transport system ATP-binding protein
MSNFAICTAGLTMEYGGRTALKDLTLCVPEGEIFGLVGHRGAGKSTAVKILTTQLAPSAGTARIAGHDIGTDQELVRREVGYVPESVRFRRNLTLDENLLYFAEASGVKNPAERVAAVLEVIDCTGHGRQRMSSCSKGMRQRAGIARAILHAPTVLFLDEPTSGVDAHAAARLRRIIVRLNGDLGMTIFMTAIALAEVAQTCTSIGILSSGYLIYQASVQATLKAFGDWKYLENLYLDIESGAQP